jgi:threonyl-tRNA synthetase
MESVPHVTELVNNVNLSDKDEFDMEVDHRRIGLNQELFFFHEMSPGSCFFLPHGARIYNKLIEFIRAEYRNRGFTEVVSPNICKKELWEVSGHWEHYHQNMFKTEIEEKMYALKPMNCPLHCLMFNHRIRSHKELPIRLADFGVLHRNELSGALTGLTRVRRFQQDDAHIFCTMDQISSEMRSCLDFLQHVYGIFGFDFQLKLSTRPEGYLGELEVWNKAEQILTDSLDAFGRPWALNPGDGAFYGPKIDITILDAHKRAHQCATIQLDFQLPIKFELKYNDGTNPSARPVMIHRAIFGSIERMIAILTESFGGKWPFWLSPRQIMVLSANPGATDYAKTVCDKLHTAGFYVDLESDSGMTLNKKILTAELASYNYVIVVGLREANLSTITIRACGKGKEQKTIGLDASIDFFTGLVNTHSLENSLPSI